MADEYDAALAIAAQDASARYQSAAVASQNAANATLGAANVQAKAEEDIAGITAANRLATAQLDAATQVQVATIGTQNQVQVATIEANARVQVAGIETTNQVAVAQISANAQVSSAVQESQGRVEAAQVDATASNFKSSNDVAINAANNVAAAQVLQVKLAFADAKFAEALGLIGEAATTVGTGSGSNGNGSIGFGAILAASREASPDYAPGAPSEGFGFYSRRTLSASEVRMGSGDVKTGGIGFAAGASVADATAATRLPFISTSGVLTPSQVQQQVNSAVARADARTQSDLRRLAGDMTGRGFSSNSPVIYALAVGLAGQNLRATLASESQIRLEAAKANADAVFQGQKAASDQFIQQEQVLLDNAKNTVTRQVGVLNAVAQIVGSAL